MSCSIDNIIENNIIESKFEIEKILENNNELKNIKENFNFFKNNNEVIYLDSASTTQILNSSLDCLINYYINNNSNVYRSSNKYDLKNREKISNIKEKIKKYLNKNTNILIEFTTGATNSLEIISKELEKYFLNRDNKISNLNVIFGKEDHRATTKYFEEYIKYNNLDNSYSNDYNNLKVSLNKISNHNHGDYNEEEIYNILKNVKEENIKTNNNYLNILVLTGVHSTTGVEMNIEEIIQKVNEIDRENTIVILDNSQLTRNLKYDLSKNEVDFIVLSSHKMYSTNGLGVIVYNKKSDVNYSDVFKYTDINSGSLNLGAIYSLEPVIDFLNNNIEDITKYIIELTKYIYYSLLNLEQKIQRNIPDFKIEFSKGINNTACKECYGILSFSFNSISSKEIGEILSENDIIIREENDCMNIKENYLRISLGVYNTIEDVDILLDVLEKIIFM